MDVSIQLERCKAKHNQPHTHIWVQNTWVRIRVRARECNSVFRLGDTGLGSTHPELRARWVKFCSVGVPSEVKGDDFVSHNVVSRCEVDGEVGCNGVTIHCDDNKTFAPRKEIGVRTDSLLEPSSVVVFAYFVNLEPFGSGRVKFVGGAVTARGEVCDYRTRIVWPLFTEQLAMTGVLSIGNSRGHCLLQPNQM